MEEAEKSSSGSCCRCGVFLLDNLSAIFSEVWDFLPALVLLHGGCAAGMLVIGCNLKRGSLLLKAILTLYSAAFLCGGFWEVIVSDKLTVKMFLILAAATWSGITALSYLMDSMRIRTKNIYPITIYYKGCGYPFKDFMIPEICLWIL